MGQATSLALATLAAMTASGLLYQLGKRHQWYQRHTLLVLKGGTTLLAALLALWGAIVYASPAAWWLFAGLLLCALADVVLELHFHAGMLVFALGHLAYIAAFLTRQTAGLLNLAIWAVLLAVVLAGGWALRGRLEQPVVPILLYASLISAMLALALTQPLAAAIGAVMFVISDGLIAYRLAFQAGRLNDDLCMLLYYGGQYLLALSALAGQ